MVWMNLKLIKPQTKYNHQTKQVLVNHRQLHRKQYHLHRHCIRLPLRSNLKKTNKRNSQNQNENFIMKRLQFNFFY